MVPSMTTDAWLVLQLADASFPAGGLAHSAGLEAALRLGALAPVGSGAPGAGAPGAGASVTRRAAGPEVTRWAARTLRLASRLELPLLGAAWDAADDDAAWHALDALADALHTARVAREASRAQGQAYLAAVASAFERPALVGWRARARAERWPAHLAPVSGRVGRALGLDRATTGRVYVHGLLRSVFGAAVRLDAIGPLEAQRLQRGLADVAEAALVDGLARAAEDASCVDPIHELLQSQQDHLTPRLFTS